VPFGVYLCGCTNFCSCCCHAAKLEVEDSDLLFPVTFNVEEVHGHWEAPQKVQHVKEDFIRALQPSCQKVASDQSQAFGCLSRFSNSIATVNASVKKDSYSVQITFKDPEVACCLALLLSEKRSFSVPPGPAASAAAAATAHAHPTDKASVSPGSIVSMLLATKYNVLHIYPVQYFSTKVMAKLVAGAGLQGGWMTELLSFELGHSAATVGNESVSYPRGFFKAHIKTGADCKPVPEVLIVDTSGITLKSDKAIKLPSPVTFKIRPRFGAGQAVADHHAADVEESMVQPGLPLAAESASKRQRTESLLL
jgi:hypothetical protein